MSGKNAGVVAKVLKEEPKALYTRCYGHSSSLACGDAIKRSKIMKESLDTTHEITKLIKKSPRRVTLFEKLKSELAPDTPGVRVVGRSPTSAEGRGRVTSLYPGLFPAATYVAVQSDCSVVKC